MGWQQSVSSFRLYEESETRNRFSEHMMEGVVMGKLAVPIEATKWPARPLSSNPAPSLRNVPQYPPCPQCGSIVIGDSHVQVH